MKKRIVLSLMLIFAMMSIMVPAVSADNRCEADVDFEIIFDSSNSARDPLWITPWVNQWDAQEIALGMELTLVNETSQVGLVFMRDDATSEILVPMTAGGQTAREALWNLNFSSATGSTSHRRALELARDDIAANVRSDAKKVIIMMSNGRSNDGGNPVEIADELKAAGVEIYVIDMGTAGWSDPGSLRTIASDPDETYYRPVGLDDINAHVKAIVTNTQCGREVPPPTPEQKPFIEGHIWCDTNGNGVHENWLGETIGYPGVNVQLFDTVTASIVVEMTVPGTSGGYYAFTAALVPWRTYVVFLLAPPALLTTPNFRVVVARPARNINNSFGVKSGVGICP